MNKKIAVAAVSKGLGKTHLALSIANFLHSVLKQRVTYIELCDESCLLECVGERPKDLGGLPGYSFMGVDYALACSVNGALRLMNSCKGFVVLDIAELTAKNVELFNRCGRKYVIGSMKPWLRRNLTVFNIMWKGGLDLNGLCFLNTGNNKKEIIEFFRDFHYPVKKLPYIGNPFSLKEAEFVPLLELIK